MRSSGSGYSPPGQRPPIPLSSSKQLRHLPTFARPDRNNWAGDSVVLQWPGGTEYLTVLEVCYERISVEPFREPPGSEASVNRLLPEVNPPDEKETKRHRW